MSESHKDKLAAWAASILTAIFIYVAVTTSMPVVSFIAVILAGFSFVPALGLTIRGLLLGLEGR